MITEPNGKAIESFIQESVKPVVVEVWASWCHNCKAFEPTYREIAEKYQEKANFIMVKADDNETFARKFKVMGVPSILYFSHGHLIKKTTGIKSEQSIIKKLEPILDYTAEDAKANEHKGFFSMLFKR